MILITYTTAAVEKTLRLAQALSQVGASLAMAEADKAGWVLARAEFNLGMFFFISSIKSRRARYIQISSHSAFCLLTSFILPLHFFGSLSRAFGLLNL
jgi:hypothetical protein